MGEFFTPGEPVLTPFDFKLDNFVSKMSSLPPPEVFVDHPAQRAVAKALMVQYRCDDPDLQQAGLELFDVQAAVILSKISYDDEGNLIYEGLTASQIEHGEYAEMCTSNARMRMRDYRRHNPYPGVPDEYDIVQRWKPGDGVIHFALVIKLISPRQPPGDAAARAYRTIRMHYVPKERFLSSSVDWYPDTGAAKAQTNSYGEMNEHSSVARSIFREMEKGVEQWKMDLVNLRERIDHEYRLNQIGFSVASDEGAGPDIDFGPVDLWSKFTPPELPEDVLPSLIEDFAILTGRQMGADPAGLAMAALCVCAATTSDEVKLKVKQHGDWYESPRLWVAVVGSPSTKKTPILSAASAPLAEIDRGMHATWTAKLTRFNATPPEDRKGKKPPLQNRLRIEDTTVEAAQQVLEGSINGIMVLQDELSGFFAAMNRYNGGGDQAFWLRSFNGGEYAYNRVGRGAGLIPNLSVSLLGGIQPEPMRKVAADAQDDGLLQRIIPIVLKPATLGQDLPMPPVGLKYRDLIFRLHRLTPPGWANNKALEFDEGAQRIRRQREARHLQLQSAETVSRKMASHFGKYDGLFARLCLTFHCIDHCSQECTEKLGAVISEAIAQRVANFMEGFLIPHAVAFYGGVLGLSDDHERLCVLANFILAHKLDKVTNRDVQRGDRAMRGLAEKDIRPLFEQLEALGWLGRAPNLRPSLPPIWVVNPLVHTKFAERAGKEAARRRESREAIKDLLAAKDR